MKAPNLFSVLFVFLTLLGSVFAQQTDVVQVDEKSWIPGGDRKWTELHRKWLELKGPKPPVRISGVSPFADCEADNPSSQIGNVTLDSEVEPWVAVNPQYPKNVVASWQQDRWSTGGARGLVAGVSYDGGESWLEIPLPGLTPCTGGEFVRASDPWLAFAPNGDLYHIALVVDHSLIEFLEGESDAGRSGMLVQKSTDGGLTWSEPVTLIDEVFPGLNDKQTITADPHDPDFVYAVWDRFELDPEGGPTLFSRTTDGGVTWEPPKVLYDPRPNAQTLANQIVVLPDGTLINFFTKIEFEGDTETLRLALKRSQDRGETWLPEGEPIFVAFMQPSFNLVDPDLGEPIRGGEELFDVAVDPLDGLLYAVWQDARFSETGEVLLSEDGDVLGFDHESVAFSLSRDGGFTWSEPVKINRTPSDIPIRNQQAFVPSVAVNRRGVVAVTYYDFRFNTEETGAMTDYWALVFEPGYRFSDGHYYGWSQEIRLTNESFDILNAPDAGGLFLGDYVGLSEVGESFITVFSMPFLTDPADVFSSRFKMGSGVRDRVVLSGPKRSDQAAVGSELIRRPRQRLGTF